VYLTGTPVPAQGATPTAIGIATQVTPVPPATGAASPNAQTSATSPAVYGPDTYPNGVNPLTGEVVDPALVNRMPIAIKISNFPYNVRPQSGLSMADLVFEHPAEAGLTRFTGVFLQNDVAKIGSIRSARFIDTELAPMFGALLVTSGSSIGTMAHLRTNPWFQGDYVWRLVSEETNYVCPPLCRDNPNDFNSLFASTKDVRAATSAKAGSQAKSQSAFVFSEALPPGGVAVTDVSVDFSSAAHVDWRYVATSRLYTRWQEKDSSGELAAHIDALTNQPITDRNVVVLFVSQVNNFVPEDFLDGGNCGLEIQLWSIGPAKVFRDGKMYEGRWRRDNSTGFKLRLEFNDGSNLALAPGNTWFELVALNAVPTLNGTAYHVLNKVVDTKSECPVPPTATPTETPIGYVAPTETPVGFVAPTDTPTP
jgi:Protein of unknown function (DUF3048) N-terminal domain/Protein of unknown function (DUF3048) C-terminal domain